MSLQGTQDFCLLLFLWSTHFLHLQCLPYTINPDFNPINLLWVILRVNFSVDLSSSSKLISPPLKAASFKINVQLRLQPLAQLLTIIYLCHALLFPVRDSRNPTTSSRDQVFFLAWCPWIGQNILSFKKKKKIVIK